MRFPSIVVFVNRMIRTVVLDPAKIIELAVRALGSRRVCRYRHRHRNRYRTRGRGRKAERAPEDIPEPNG
jgi:hypothetical protein